MITVEKAVPTDPGPATLLAEAQALQAALYPPENNHALPTEALLADNVRFLAARDGQALLGVGAIKLEGDHAEVKSMFTAPAGRGKGIAAAILRALEDIARDEGATMLKLETGDELVAACRLYARHGFTRCGAFGDYADDGSSVFMEKAL